VADVKSDYRRADLSALDRVILDFAGKLTLEPWSMTERDVEQLRSAGLDDAGVSDVVQVTALFAYYNRLADGLGVDLEPEFGRR
jgi:uncharacterized peroxidase-related enzyme